MTQKSEKKKRNHGKTTKENEGKHANEGKKNKRKSGKTTKENKGKHANKK